MKKKKYNLLTENKQMTFNGRCTETEKKTTEIQKEQVINLAKDQREIIVNSNKMTGVVRNQSKQRQQTTEVTGIIGKPEYTRSF